MAIKQRARGPISWFLQRITAILLAYFAVWHIIILHFISTGKITFDRVIERLHEAPFFWRTFYFLFIPTVLFHGLNGLWGVIIDYAPSKKFRIVFGTILWVIGIALTYMGIKTIITLI